MLVQVIQVINQTRILYEARIATGHITNPRVYLIALLIFYFGKNSCRH